MIGAMRGPVTGTVAPTMTRRRGSADTLISVLLPHHVL